MSKIRLLIASEDQEYASALARILVNKYDSFHVETAFENWEEKFTDENLKKEFDLILWETSPKDKSKAQKSNYEKKILLLTEEKFAENFTLSEQKVSNLIYKYAGAAKIASDLSFYYLELSGKTKTAHTAASSELLFFTSAAGNVGKTVLSIATARELSAFHRQRVLLLSFESPESIGFYLNGAGGNRGLNDYLYYLFMKNNQDVAPDPDAFLAVDRWGVEFFCPSRLKNELPELTIEQAQLLISALCSFRNYDYICCDIMASASERCFALFEIASKLILIDDGKPLSLLKNEKLRSAYSFFQSGSAEERSLIVTNKWKNEYDAAPDDKSDIYIENDPDSFRMTSVGMEIEMDRCFGLGVKKLAEKIRRKI